MTEPRRIGDLSTPALLVDLDAFDANVAAADALLGGSGVMLRPHVKTHRTPGLVIRQLTAPTASGVTCATVGEAEVMVAAGIEDVLLANEIASARKADRLAILAGRARVIAAVDSPGVVEALSDAARRAGTRIDVLVDVDVGLNRCGVPDEDSAVALAARADASPSLRVAGLMGYEGRIRADESDRGDRLARAAEILDKTKAAMDAAGFDTSTVSSSGTSTLIEAREDPSVTEIQAGTYALMESDLDGLGLPFVPALSLVAAVISVAPGRVVLNSGRKSIAGDYGSPEPIDAAVKGARTVAFHEEHTTLDWPGPLPVLDARIILRPNHVRLTFNLHDTVWLVRGGEVVERLPVSARGRSE